jgi:membrane associated rhomboid family serine protease
MLVFIGSELEASWGMARFLRYYFMCAMAGGVFYLLLQLLVWRADVPMVGASAGIYGLLMAYGLIFGERVMLFMMLFPMKAKHFVWILAAVEFLSGVFSGRGGLASVAHLGGMVAGFGLLWGRAAWTVAKRGRAERQQRDQKTKRRKSAKHLKLVVGGQEAHKKIEDDSDDHPKTWH